jgi:hypothetical protein
VWLFPPLKQFRGKFFYYFLIQAISDPIAFTLIKLHYYNIPFYVVKDIFLMLCLWNLETAIKKSYWIVPVLLLIYYFVYGIDYRIIYLILSVVHIGILYFIFKMATDDMLELKRVKVFYMVFILYELSLVLKFILQAAAVNLGSIYYFLTAAFDILLGIFFIFVSERNEKFAIPIPDREKIFS